MSKSAIEMCAEEATFQVSCAMNYMDWMRATLHVLRDRLADEEGMKHYATLAEIAILNADDWHSQLDAECKGFEEVLKAEGWKV